MMKTHKIALLGCGAAALLIHLPIILRMVDKFDVVAVCDTSLEKSDFTAQRYGVPYSTDNLAELLKMDFQTLVVLSSVHEEAIQQGIQAGKNIITEKPISLDLDKSIRLVEDVQKNNLKFYVTLMRQYDSAYNTLIKNLDLSTMQMARFSKIDGSDHKYRRIHLPEKFETYSFHRSPSPILPRGYKKTQIEALKVLLWTGMHQLTAMCNTFKNLEIVNCYFERGNILSVYKTATDQNIHLSLINVSPAIYQDEIEIVTSEQIGRVFFRSPYLSLSDTQTMLVKNSDEGGVSTASENGYFDAFGQMWQAFYLDLYNDIGESKKNVALALEVERLAHETVKKISKG